MLLCLNSNVIMKFSCDYGENHWTHGWLQSVILIFFAIWLSKVLLIRRHRPHVILDTQMTVKYEFKIWTSARWRFVVHSVQFSAPCLLKLRKFSLQRLDFEGVIPLGTIYARSYYSERKVFKFKIYISGKTKLGPGRLCYFCDGPEAKYCYYKLKSLRNPFRLKRGWRLVFREVII